MRPRWSAALVAVSAALVAGAVYAQAAGADQSLYATLTRWLASPDGPRGQEAIDVATFLAERRHADAYPVIERRLREAPPGEGAPFADALLLLGAKHAMGPVISRIADLRGHDGAAREEALRITRRIASFGIHVRLDYGVYRAALPQQLTERDMRAVLELARARRELMAAEDLVTIMLEPRLREEALGALLALESPDILRRARTLIDALWRDGMLDEVGHRLVSSALDEKLAVRPEVSPRR